MEILHLYQIFFLSSGGFEVPVGNWGSRLPSKDGPGGGQFPCPIWSAAASFQCKDAAGRSWEEKKIGTRRSWEVGNTVALRAKQFFFKHTDMLANRRARWAEEDKKREEEARRRHWDEQKRMEEQRKAEEDRRREEEARKRQGKNYYSWQTKMLVQAYIRY